MADIGNSKFVVGIDIGETYSGYAFASLNDLNLNPPKLTTNTWKGYNLLSLKCPTAILLNRREEFVNFGYEAQEKFAELVTEDEDHNYYYFRNFERLLHQGLRVPRSTLIKSGRRMNILKVISATIGYFKLHVLAKIKQTTRQGFVDDDVHYVINISDISSHHEQQFLMEAAMQAGIKEERIAIVKDSKAALLYIQQSLYHLELDKRIRTGEKYMVIDLGAITNISCHRQCQNETIEEIVASSRVSWGGKSIDKAFDTFLCQICGPHVMQLFESGEPVDYYILFSEFEREKRRIGSNTVEKVVITLPVSLCDLVKQKHRKFEEAINRSCYKKTVNYSNFKLYISPDTFRGLFDPTVREIIKYIEKMQTNPEVKDINILIMVGGFSECLFLQDAMYVYFGKSKSVVIPEEAGTAVMKGAVLFALQSNIYLGSEQQPMANTDSLLNRLSKMHGNDFKDFISKGDFASYENRVYLAGACNIGKSSLASILIGDEVPKKWYSTDGLVIHFGRNGIHLEDKKMIPLGESDTNILKKLLLGNPNFNATTTDNRKLNSPTNIQNRVQEDSQLETNSSLASEYVDHCEHAEPAENAEYAENAEHAEYDEHVEHAEKVIENISTNTEADLTPSTENPRDLKSVEFKEEETSNLLPPHVTRQTPISIQSDVLQEIRDGTYKMRVAPSDLVDFGGQRSFDMTHQLFIQHKGTFVLMFDGRYGLNSPLKEYPQGDITAKDILVHWVNSILIYCGEGNDKMPMIMFAATHSDYLLLVEITAKKLQFTSELTELFQHHSQKKHIIFDRFFFINATNRDDPEIELLKYALVDIAFEQPTWGQRMPIAWVPLEMQISALRTKDINLVTKDKIRELNLANPEFMLNEFRLDEFLKLQHSLGKIMYFDQPALQNFVIIQPSAMVNILRSFVTDKMFWPEDKGLRKTLEGMVNTGMVKKAQLFDLWSQPQFKELLSSAEHREYIIQVLVHLDILVEPKREDNQGSQNETYLVPCLVKSTIPVEFVKFEEQKTICLAYQLTETLIPSSLTFKLIGAAIATWPLKEAKGRVCLYYQSAIMHVDESNELLLIIKGQRVEIYLSNQSSKHLISPDVAASIQECLTLVLQRVLLFYHECFGRSTSKLDVLNLFEIEVGVICKGELCVVPLFQAEKKKPWTCEKNQKHETRYCLYWVFNKHIRTCDVTCKGLEAEALSLNPNDMHLVRLAKQIGINLFDQFLLYLGLTRDEWEEIEYQYRQNGLLGMKLMALYEWKKKNETVKLQELLDALNGIERPHYLCQIVREDTNLYGIAESRLQKSPTDEVLNELSRRLGNCVIQLGIELGLNFGSIEESMYRFPKDMYGQIYDILKKWKQQTSIRPTIHRLMMALQRVDSGGLSFLRVKYK